MTGSPSSPAPGAVVLVVDDDWEIRESVRDVLEDEGFAVATARNGLEALEYLRSSAPPGLVLLDLSMPVMDGASFCEEKQRDPTIAPIPVVVFSATANLAEKARALPVAAYLRKPMQLDELVATAVHFVKRSSD